MLVSVAGSNQYLSSVDTVTCFREQLHVRLVLLELEPATSWVQGLLPFVHATPLLVLVCYNEYKDYFLVCISVLRDDNWEIRLCSSCLIPLHVVLPWKLHVVFKVTWEDSNTHWTLLRFLKNESVMLNMVLSVNWLSVYMCCQGTWLNKQLENRN